MTPARKDYPTTDVTEVHCCSLQLVKLPGSLRLFQCSFFFHCELFQRFRFISTK